MSHTSKGGSRLDKNTDNKPGKIGWRAKRRAWLAHMSPKERILRRVLLVLAILAAVVLAAAAVYFTKVRAPEIPIASSTASESSATSSTSSTVTRAEGYYTFLLVGQDVASGSTDTIMLVSFDVTNGKLNVLSIPRDTMVNVSWSTKKINSVYSMKGMDALREKVKDTTGIAPDYYVLIQWEAVGKLVDAIGGVEFEVPYDMNYDDPDQDLHIHLTAGMQTLSGEQAMELVRWRKNNSGTSLSVGDTGRIEIQHNFLKAAITQLLQLKNVTKITDFAKIFSENVNTDLETGNLLWLAEQASTLSSDNIQFFTLPANMGGMYNNLSYVFPYPDQIVTMVNENFNPTTTPITLADLQIMQLRSDGSLYVTNGTLEDKKAAAASSSTSKSSSTSSTSKTSSTSTSSTSTSSTSTSSTSKTSSTSSATSSAEPSAEPSVQPSAEPSVSSQSSAQSSSSSSTSETPASTASPAA